MSPEALLSEELIAEHRREQNRRNAENSTGPTTERGKNVSKMNALRHGLTGAFTIMPWEDRIVCEAFLTAQESDWKPENSMERELAVSIAQDLWRLQRSRAVDQNLYTISHPGMTGVQTLSTDLSPEIRTAACDAEAFKKDAKQFQLLTLYEQRIHRNMEKNVTRLEKLQAERKTARDHAFEEARLLARLDEMEGQLRDAAANAPAVNGFVFSNAEIHAANLHAERLEVAKFHERHHWDPKYQYPYPRIQPVSLPKAA